MRKFIHELNQFLNRPVAIILTLIILFAYFAIATAHFEKENQHLLINTKRSADNTNVIIKQQQVQLEAQKKEIGDLQNHIDCIITFFGLSNRTQLKIADVCHFTSTSSPESILTPQALHSTSTPVTPQSNAKSQQAAGASNDANAPSTSGSSPPAQTSRDGVTIDLPLLPPIHIPSLL